jgi:hypothetical protein
MEEYPILFSGPMVRAILEDRKTMTRRVLKPQPKVIHAIHPDASITTNCIFRKGDQRIHCPYGQPGDRLWVRETWSAWTGGMTSCGEERDIIKGKIDLETQSPQIEYKATSQSEGPWRPSIFMPRWASRIRLEVTDVRVERLNEISEEDAIAEGFDLKLCEAVLYAAAGEVEPDEAYWVTDADHEDLGEGYLCHDCAKALQEKNPGSHISYGCCPESDGPAMCEVCYRPLYLSLTEYGIERELFLECPSDEDRKNFAASGSDACIAAMIASGYCDLRDHHRGRLAQIGFATLWDSLNEKRGFSWKNNPWVWVVSFERVNA